MFMAISKPFQKLLICKNFKQCILVIFMQYELFLRFVGSVMFLHKRRQACPLCSQISTRESRGVKHTEFSFQRERSITFFREPSRLKTWWPLHYQYRQATPAPSYPYVELVYLEPWFLSWCIESIFSSCTFKSFNKIMS